MQALTQPRGRKQEQTEGPPERAEKQEEPETENVGAGESNSRATLEKSHWSLAARAVWPSSQRGSWLHFRLFKFRRGPRFCKNKVSRSTSLDNARTQITHQKASKFMHLCMLCGTGCPVRMPCVGVCGARRVGVLCVSIRHRHAHDFTLASNNSHVPPKSTPKIFRLSLVSVSCTCGVCTCGVWHWLSFVRRAVTQKEPSCGASCTIKTSFCSARAIEASVPRQQTRDGSKQLQRVCTRQQPQLCLRGARLVAESPRASICRCNVPSCQIVTLALKMTFPETTELKTHRPSKLSQRWRSKSNIAN